MKHGFLVAALTVFALAAAVRPADADPGALAGTATILDTSFCLASAPPDAPCDIRLGSHPNVSRVLGITVCRGDIPSGIRCDVSLPAPSHSTDAAAARLTPRVVPIFGTNVCFGDVAPTARCDLRVGDGSASAALDSSSPTRGS